MPNKSSSKNYVNQAVQTDFSGSSCNPLFSQHLEYRGTNEAEISDAAFCLDMVQLSLESAYTQPSPQDFKYPALTYSRPSGQAHTSHEKRAVSLPGSASLGIAKTIVSTKARVVSMPERREKHDFNASNTQSESPVSPDAGSYSVDISAQAQVRQRKRERRYPSDTPRTPTPPSSPDSIMIIGDEGSQVSGSFLRRQQIDEHGWITWASSPPRPIPALHGPLSLPYARCPSGAEGTVIEGDDLSHKIWGLGVDDVQGHPRPIRSTTNPVFQSGASRNTSSVVNSHRDHQEHFQRHQPLPLHHRDEVIDLSKPSSFFGHIELQNNFNRRALDGTQSQLFPQLTENSTHPDGFDQHIFKGQRPFNNDVSSINLDSRLRDPRVLGQEWHNLPLMSDTNGHTGTHGLHGRSSNNLNKSAAVFVPAKANNNPRHSLGDYMRSSVEHKSDAYLQTIKLPNVANVAQQYDRQSNYDLITPPSTSSPRWSPVFLPQNSAIGLDREPTSTQKVPLVYGNPMVYSPDAEDEYSSNRFTIQFNPQGHDNAHDQFKATQNFGSHSSTFASTDVGSSTNLKGFTQSTLRPESSPMALAPSNQFENNYESVLVEQTGRSSERRRNLSYQHPRSIPLARLIQRRLSTVTEEEATLNHESLLPLLRKNLPNSFLKHLSTEPLHAQSSLNQISIQVTRELPRLGIESKEEPAQLRLWKGPTTLNGESAMFKPNRVISVSRQSPTHQKTDTVNDVDYVHDKENNKNTADPTDIRKPDCKKPKPRKRKSNGGTTLAPAPLSS